VLEQEAGADRPPAQPAQGSDEVAQKSPPSDSVAATLAPFRKSEAIGKLLQLASDTDITEEERLLSLDQVWKHYKALFEKDEPAFLGELFAPPTRSRAER
jgi:hypothetical protein